MSIDDVLAQVHKVQELMRLVMKEGEHYGVIPGTDKPTLLKPGAEKLCMTFRLNPQYEILSSVEDNSLISYTVLCHLVHINTGTEWGQGIGACNSREKKYRYMWVPQPEKPEHSEAEAMKLSGVGGWRKVKGQWVWHLRYENDNAWDVQNTIAKMASKRALVAAVLNATAASDIFTQDLDEDVTRSDTSAYSAPRVGDDMLTAIRQARILLEKRSPELWGETVFMANVKRRFNVEKLEDISSEQGKMIWDGMVAFQDQLDAEAVVEPDVVEEAEEETNSEEG